MVGDGAVVCGVLLQVGVEQDHRHFVTAAAFDGEEPGLHPHVPRLDGDADLGP